MQMTKFHGFQICHISILLKTTPHMNAKMCMQGGWGIKSPPPPLKKKTCKDEKKGLHSIVETHKADIVIFYCQTSEH